MNMVDRKIKRVTPSQMVASRKEFLALVEKHTKNITMEKLASVGKKAKPEYKKKQQEHSLIIAALTKTFGKDKVAQMPVKERQKYFNNLVVRARQEKAEEQAATL